MLYILYFALIYNVYLIKHFSYQLNFKIGVKLSPQEEESSDSEDTEENVEKAEKAIEKKFKEYEYPQ